MKRQNPSKPGRKPGSTTQEQKDKKIRNNFIRTSLTKRECYMQYVYVTNKYLEDDIYFFMTYLWNNYQR